MAIEFNSIQLTQFNQNISDKNGPQWRKHIKWRKVQQNE